MRIYLEKDFGYRRWQVLVGRIILTLIIVILLYRFYLPVAIKVDWTPFKWTFIPTFLVVFVIPLLFIHFGPRLVNAWSTEKKLHLEISDFGVRYGSQECPWAQIEEFSYFERQNGKSIFIFHKMGGFFSHSLPLTDALTEVEVNDLFARLKEEVAPLHPNLHISEAKLIDREVTAGQKQSDLLDCPKVNPAVFFSIYSINLICIFAAIWIYHPHNLGFYTNYLFLGALGFIFLWIVLKKINNSSISVEGRGSEQTSHPFRFWYNLLLWIVAFLFVSGYSIKMACQEHENEQQKWEQKLHELNPPQR